MTVMYIHILVELSLLATYIRWWERKFQGAKVPGSEVPGSEGSQVWSDLELSLPGANGLGSKSIIQKMGHMNIRGPQLFYSFFIRWMKVVRIGALFADWSCAS